MTKFNSPAIISIVCSFIISMYTHKRQLRSQSYLLISASKVSFVPLEYLTQSHFSFPRIHHTAVVVLQEGLSRCAQLAVNVLFNQNLLQSIQAPEHSQY